MISTTHSQYKALTAPQRAKVRKAIAEYEAERNPIMWAKHKLEEEIRHQTFEDMDGLKLCQQIEDEFNPQIEELTKKINELCDERRRLEDAKRERFSEVRSEPYRAAGNHPKSILLGDMWKDVNARHEAKIAELLESFKAEGVA
jgi:septal ring factor EnvC (AmiA/AmiB activator)